MKPLIILLSLLLSGLVSSSQTSEETVDFINKKLSIFQLNNRTNPQEYLVGLKTNKDGDVSIIIENKSTFYSGYGGPIQNYILLFY